MVAAELEARGEDGVPGEDEAPGENEGPRIG
jgi:hypothetical protein